MSRAVTLMEVMVAAALVIVLVAAIALPGYRSYAQSRASEDAASTLAADLVFLEREAQNSSGDDGASLLVDSINPFSYRGYLGRPRSLDPGSTLDTLLIERSFPGVQLDQGPIDSRTPLLFANNGSAQYESHGIVASQHQTIRLVLTTTTGGRMSAVDLNLFTGAVQLER